LRAATTTANMAATASSKPACETFNRTNRWVPSIMQNSPSYPLDKPAHTWADWPLPPQKKNNTLNCNLVQQQRGWECWKCTSRVGSWSQSSSPETVSSMWIITALQNWKTNNKMS
jgi:hypothetical protein